MYFVLSLWGPDIPIRHQRTSGDEGRLASPVSWRKLCTWTHHKDYSQRPTRKFCTCVRGNTSPYQQVAVVYIHHSKRDTRRPMAVDIYKHEMKQHLPTILTPLSLRRFCNITTSNREYLKMMNDQMRWSWKMIFVCVPSWRSHCFAHFNFSSLAPILLELNSQSEWFHSPTASVPDSTCWISWKTADKGRLVQTVRDTPQKLRLLTDARLSPSADCQPGVPGPFP